MPQRTTPIGTGLALRFQAASRRFPFSMHDPRAFAHGPAASRANIAAVRAIAPRMYLPAGGL